MKNLIHQLSLRTWTSKPSAKMGLMHGIVPYNFKSKEVIRKLQWPVVDRIWPNIVEIIKQQ